MRNTRIAIVLIASTLSACTGPNHPDIISASGVDKTVIAADGTELGLMYQFKKTAEAAMPIGGVGDPGPVAQRLFLRAGFALTYAKCNEYIQGKSRNQRRVNVWRDTIAPITALATGVIALADSGETINNDVLTALSLTTNVASSGFKIYEERYLFGAENVNSVRRLVLAALTADSAQALETSDAKLTYGQSVIHLINNQAICSPSNILEMVSDAIDQGKPSSKPGDNQTQPGSDDAKVDSISEVTELKKLIDRLQREGKISAAEIAQVNATMATERTSPPPDAGFDTVQTRVTPPKQ
jgi:hypothetical protein